MRLALKATAARSSSTTSLNAIALPKTGAPLTIGLGFLETGGPQLIGDYVVDRVEGGNDGNGWTMTIVGRAADLGKGLKEQRRISYPEGITVGAVFGKIAGRNGLKSKVDDSIKGKPLPRDLAVQNNESDLAFATRIGRRFDALVKVAGGTLLCIKRGSGGLPPVAIVAGQQLSIRYSVQDRPKHKTVEAQWRDRKANKTEVVSVKCSDDGPVMRLPTTYPDEAAAQRCCGGQEPRAAARRGSVTVTVQGRPSAAAEADVVFAAFARRSAAHFWQRGWSTSSTAMAAFEPRSNARSSRADEETTGPDEPAAGPSDWRLKPRPMHREMTSPATAEAVRRA